MTSSAARRRPLDRRTILQAALGLVDAEGFESLSMRKLGALLGVEAMTLYYYVPSKAALVQGIAEVVLDELRVPEPPVEDWRQTTRAMARSFRELGLRHPNVFPVLASVGLDNASSYRPTEAILQVLEAAGFPKELAFTAFSTIKSYVVGHTLWLLGDQVLARGERVPTPEAVEVEGFPIVASYLPYVAECDPADEFERGLDMLIAGLDAERRSQETA
jgi:AcrR family transcriptional regulator